MNEIQAGRNADSVITAAENDDHSGNSFRPTFDVIGLLKEGSKSIGLAGKEIVDGLVSPAEAAESRSANYAGYKSVDEKNDAMMIGGLLVFPTGMAGLFTGLKAGAEVGELVGGPSGMFYGGFVGMTAGALGGAALAGYAGEKISHWMEESR